MTRVERKTISIPNRSLRILHLKRIARTMVYKTWQFGNHEIFRNSMRKESLPFPTPYPKPDTISLISSWSRRLVVSWFPNSPRYFFKYQFKDIKFKKTKQPNAKDALHLLALLNTSVLKCSAGRKSMRGIVNTEVWEVESEREKGAILEPVFLFVSCYFSPF